MRILAICTLIWLSAYAAFAQSGNIGFGTLNPDSSAMLDISSTSKGLLIPRMTSAEREAVANPAKGLIVFDSTTVSLWFFNGNAWQLVAPEPPPLPSNILFQQLDQVGIANNTETPLANWSMPANTLLTPGESIELHAFGENIADTAIIRFKFGSLVLPFQLQSAGIWDARISLYYKSATEVKIFGTFHISGKAISRLISGNLDQSQVVQFIVSAEQNQAVLNGVGMEGLVIYRKK
ncbi:MAG: hypothetical protein IT240_00525 [Bacteroidia bacterium]|jgi:hypothetical protein|nr:hypothetical protein [Bacteroidia bacterium]MCC6767501.1 hypothetical protein [Bacteroidia bacterium]